MRTKIICSIGPATESKEMLEKMIEGGMNIARLNFSHDTHEAHGRRVDEIREVAKRLNKKVEILCDLQGPKIRVREFDNPPIQLCDGEEIVFVTSACEDIKPGEIVIEDPYLHTDVQEKDVILIDDGQIELAVSAIENHRIYCEVVNGGFLYPRKGVNLPFTETTTSSLTDKDIKDLEFIKTKNPDWVAISFVQSKKDVDRVRELLGNHPAKVMCKIERANAIQNIGEIIRASDAIMVARGDLGVEIPIEKLPIVQKQIIKRCNYDNVPVVTATQMLASMVKSPFPTRAEVTDIANAIIDGTNAIMMSNETTVGDYPLQALSTMRKVAEATEEYIFNRPNPLES